MPAKPVLIVLTSHDRLGDTGENTGFHYEEMTTPYYLFSDAGFTVELASIMGGKPPHDPGSLHDKASENAGSVMRFLHDEEAMRKLSNTRSVEQINASGYSAIYLPGGHGTMWDFAQSQPLGEVVSRMYQAGKPVAAVCHGPAGLIAAHDAMGQPIMKHRRINCFTNDEEIAVGKDKVVPFLLETALRELNGKFESSGKFEPHVVQDGNLITGQNPASAEGVANAVIKQLRENAAKAA